MPITSTVIPVKGVVGVRVVFTAATKKGRRVSVVAEMTGPALPAPPSPQYSTVPLPGRIGLTRYTGQEPYAVTIPIRLGGSEYPIASVEDDVITLESFGEVQDGQTEPPVVDVQGPIASPHPNVDWRIVDFGEPVQEALADGDRSKYETTLTLQQRVTDTVLAESLAKSGKGITNRRYKVKRGQDSLYDVALAVYGDPSKAADIARANPVNGLPWPLGGGIAPGTNLRIP